MATGRIIGIILLAAGLLFCAIGGLWSAANLATGYSRKGGELQAAPLAYAVMAPASAVTVTSIDMAAFMIAHLHDGEYGNNRILEQATIQEMHRQQFTHHPDIWRKIIIPADLKWELRDKLDQANISERVLFPGLDGLSSWLKRQYSPKV